MAHVLVIDAHAMVRQVVHAALEGEGHTVALAADGGAGLKAFEAQPADLVLCDLAVVEGPETLQALRAGHPGLKVILLDAVNYFRAEPLAMAAALGAVATLDKPFTLAELLRVVGAALAGG
jgi:CheY-like chemotaxis protein